MSRLTTCSNGVIALDRGGVEYQGSFEEGSSSGGSTTIISIAEPIRMRIHAKRSNSKSYYTTPSSSWCIPITSGPIMKMIHFLVTHLYLSMSENYSSHKNIIWSSCFVHLHLHHMHKSWHWSSAFCVHTTESRSSLMWVTIVRWQTNFSKYCMQSSLDWEIMLMFLFNLPPGCQ